MGRMRLVYAVNVPDWVVLMYACMLNVVRIGSVAGTLLMLGCDTLHVKSNGTEQQGPERDAGEADAGRKHGAAHDRDAGGHDAITGDAGQYDAGLDECATVGCGAPPLCSEGCQEHCGCCACADGEREDRNGVAMLCTGGCFAPLEADAGPDCSAVPGTLAHADVVEAGPYVPPPGCTVKQVLRVDSEQAFQSAFQCADSVSSGIDFSLVRLEMFSAGYVGGEPPYRSPGWARSENGVLTVGWTEVVYCGGPQPQSAYTLALVPLTAPSNVQGAPCTSGMCDPNQMVP
jgi:hypothetical protein